MKLQGGPADGREIPTPKEWWVWVSVAQGQLLVFDLNRPECEQHLNRVGKGGWDEYIQDPHDKTVYQWARRTPATT